MRRLREELWFEFSQRRGLKNITGEVKASLRESGVREGLVLANAMHIIPSVFIHGDKSGLHHDLKVARAARPECRTRSLTP